MISTLSRLCHWKMMGMVVLVAISSYFVMDRPIAAIIYQYPFLYQSRFFSWLTYLGSATLMLITFLSLYSFSRILNCCLRWRLFTLQTSLSLIIGTLLVSTIKIIAGRARPLLWLEDDQFGFYGFKLQDHYWSFPSGHSMTIMVIASSLALIYRSYALLWFCLVIIVIVTRIVLLKHFFSDVLVSTYLAILISVLVYNFREKWQKWV